MAKLFALNYFSKMLLTQPLLRANRDKAVAQAKQAELAWQAAVLSAVEEVQVAQSDVARTTRAVAATRRSVASYGRVVTLSRQTGLAEFPDSVTARGTKHLGELARMTAQGHRAIMLYLVQRTDCDRLRLAEDLDPAYAAAFRAARAAGVEAICHRCEIDVDGVRIGPELPVEIA